MKNLNLSSALILGVFFAIGCAPYHCRQAPKIEAQTPVGEAMKAAPDEATGSRRVRVFRYDGSLQCGQGKAVAVDVMAKDLKGLEIFSKEKKKDGLMHIQVCGAATGTANVYEISEADLPRAEKLGFKKWTFE